MTFRLDIELMGLPKPINRQSGQHWTERARLAKEWHRAVALAIGPLKPPKPLSHAKLTCTRISSVAPDFDGLVSSFKYPLDALVVCGVIEDDSMAVIGVPEFKWEKCKPKEGRIKIQVEELE